MSKMLEASCAAGMVTVGGIPVLTADILSQGVGASTGILILDDAKAKYLAKTSPDLKTTIEKLITILGNLTAALTLIDTKALITTCGAGPGTAAPLPLAMSDIAALTVIQAELTVLKETLK